MMTSSTSTSSDDNCSELIESDSIVNQLSLLDRLRFQLFPTHVDSVVYGKFDVNQDSSQALNAAYVPKSWRIMRIMGIYSKNNGKSNNEFENRIIG